MNLENLDNLMSVVGLNLSLGLVEWKGQGFREPGFKPRKGKAYKKELGMVGDTMGSYTITQLEPAISLNKSQFNNQFPI